MQRLAVIWAASVAILAVSIAAFIVAAGRQMSSYNIMTGAAPNVWNHVATAAIWASVISLIVCTTITVWAARQRVKA
jgi:hypothetical protein